MTNKQLVFEQIKNGVYNYEKIHEATGVHIKSIGPIFTDYIKELEPSRLLKSKRTETLLSGNENYVDNWHIANECDARMNKIKRLNKLYDLHSVLVWSHDIMDNILKKAYFNIINDELTELEYDLGY